MQIYDPLRAQYVAATPEEIVRQKWVEVMLDHLSFPKELLAIEKKLSKLPHLEHQEVPDRRLDLLAYSQIEGVLKPLLLIECKCTPINEKALYQVKGYNEYVMAPYFAVANETEILLGYLDENQKLNQMGFLPSYNQLQAALN